MAPRPPEVPRVLRSKSWTSSKIPVQLKMRCSCGPAPLENEPSSEVDWRGPAAKLQVMLSVRPSGWQLPHELQPSLAQRPRPVKKKRWPRFTAISSADSGGLNDSTVV